MDQQKLNYFVSKYEAMSNSDIMDLRAQVGDMAEESEAALRQVAAARGVSIREATPPRSQLTEQEIEERAFSPIRAELIHVRKTWFLWSLLIALAAGSFYGAFSGMTKDSPFGLLVALCGLFAIVWPLYCLYKLSYAVDPRRSVAWAMVVAVFVPIIGWIAPISLVLKASRIRKVVQYTSKVS